MKNYLCLSLVYFLFVIPNAMGIKAETTVEPPQASIEDFRAVLGTHTGTLAYKDYSGGQWVTLDLVGVSYLKKDKFIVEHLIYEGSVYRQKYEFSFKNGKANVNGQSMKILENTFSQAENKRMVLTHPGKDGNDNRKCTFRYTLSYENDQLSIVKEVKFDDEQEFFKRNQYTLQHQ